MEYRDKEIKCIDCGSMFSWTAQEQQYYASKRLSEPKRCPECRRRRRNSIVPNSK